jgi:putative FmdB family regulatory protein
MPVFEYKCKKCNTKFEVLHKSALNTERVACPNCSSINIKKLLSSFSTTSGNISNFPGEECNSGSCRCNDNYSGGCASGLCGLDN